MPSTTLKTGTLQASTQEAINAAAQAQASATAAQGYAASIIGAVAQAIDAEDGAEAAQAAAGAAASAAQASAGTSSSSSQAAQGYAITAEGYAQTSLAQKNLAVEARIAAQAAQTAAEAAAQTSGANANATSQAKTAAEAAAQTAETAITDVGLAVDRAETAASTSAADALTASEAADLALASKNAAELAANQAQQYAGRLPYIHVKEEYLPTDTIPDAADAIVSGSTYAFARNLNKVVSNTIPNADIITSGNRKYLSLPVGTYRVRGVVEAGLVPAVQLAFSGLPGTRPVAWAYANRFLSSVKMPLDAAGNPRGGLVAIETEFIHYGAAGTMPPLALIQIQSQAVVGQFPQPALQAAGATAPVPFLELIFEKVG